MSEADELIAQLKDFRVRSAAKSALLDMGDRAVEPLVRALGSRNVSVRWSAVTILGELGARRAVPALVEALRDTQVRSAAAEALLHITGEEFGDDYDAWKRWLTIGTQWPEGRTATAPAADGQDDSDLVAVAAAVAGPGIKVAEHRRGYVLTVDIGDRHQDVFINFRSRDSEGVPLVVVYTRCGPADPARSDWALEQNLKMTAGALAIAEIDGKREFVVVDVLVRSATTPEVLAESVKRIARKADQIEALLTKGDQH